MCCRCSPRQDVNAVMKRFLFRNRVRLYRIFQAVFLAQAPNVQSINNRMGCIGVAQLLFPSKRSFYPTSSAHPPSVRLRNIMCTKNYVDETHTLYDITQNDSGNVISVGIKDCQKVSQNSFYIVRHVVTHIVRFAPDVAVPRSTLWEPPFSDCSSCSSTGSSSWNCLAAVSTYFDIGGTDNNIIELDFGAGMREKGKYSSESNVQQASP